MRGRRIRARGAGPAAFAVAKLLLDRGAEVIIDAQTQRKRRIVAISMETVALAARIFDIDPDELKIGPIVEERRVDWSTEGPATMPDAALVCDAGDFSAVLQPRSPTSGDITLTNDSLNEVWTSTTVGLSLARASRSAGSS